VSEILVVGGSYFAGRVFVEELVKASGHAVTVLNRGRIPMGMPGVREIRCDRHDAQAMHRCLAGRRWEAVVDFCAYSPDDIRILLESLPAHATSHIILMSTASVYAHTSSLPVDESVAVLMQPQPELGPMAEYGWQKARAEAVLREMCGPRDIAFTILRPTIIFGKYNYAPRESWFFDRILAGTPVPVPTDSLALFSFVSVWDLARLTISCLGAPAARGMTFNAAGREMVSYEELVRVLTAAVEHPFPTHPISCKALAEGGEQLPFPVDEHLVYSGMLSEGCLGFRYSGFAEEMKRAWKYYSAARRS
jgi:2'-hydroxyisoflavone reductase